MSNKTTVITIAATLLLFGRGEGIDGDAGGGCAGGLVGDGAAGIGGVGRASGWEACPCPALCWSTCDLIWRCLLCGRLTDCDAPG
jgi:hypothetical protein